MVQQPISQATGREVYFKILTKDSVIKMHILLTKDNGIHVYLFTYTSTEKRLSLKPKLGLPESPSNSLWKICFDLPERQQFRKLDFQTVKTRTTPFLSVPHYQTDLHEEINILKLISLILNGFYSKSQQNSLSTNLISCLFEKTPQHQIFILVQSK